MTQSERPIWLLGPDARPVPLAEAKAEPKGGWAYWWCREGSGETWQPIETLKVEIGTTGQKNSKNPRK